MTTHRHPAVRIVTAMLALLMLGGLAACSSWEEPDKNTASERDKLQSKKAGPDTPTLEKTNLEEKRKREENPDAIGYIYLMNFGKIVGYYVTKGKISSNGSQATPEQQIVYACDDGLTGCQAVVVSTARKTMAPTATPTRASSSSPPAAPRW